MSMRSSCLLVLSALFLSSWCAEASAAALDNTFGLDGRVAVDLGIRGSRANAVIAQPDGKIVAAGSATSTADRDFMLFRLLPDGSLDTSFNIDGTVTTAVGSFDDEALSLALQADGKIVAGGYSSTEKDRDFALVRYNSDGSIDRSFGNEGIVSTGVGSSHDEITDVVVQDDGNIVITGAAQGANGRVVVLGRYLTNGKLDPNFGQEGFALSVVGVDAQAESVALSKEGRILVAGTYSDGNRRGLMVVGFKSNGQLEQQFGDKGVAVPADNSTFSEGYGMFVNEDGKILVAGSVGKEGERDAALFSFTAEGRPDSSFEKNGVLVSSAGEGDDVLLDVAPAGENIAAAGFKTTGENREFLLITYTKGTAEENTGGSSLSMQTGGVLKADALTTGFSSGKDTSTSLATLSNESVVAVGESEAEAGSSAAVSKYTLLTGEGNNILGGGSKLSPGNQYVVTGEPYEVTRTTAIIPAEILDGLSDVTERGIVFGTMPNPVLKEGSSSSSGSGTAPVITNNSPSSVTGTSATLSLTTDVDATCRYTDSSSGMDYDQMKNDFDTTGGKSHLEPLSNLPVGSHTYYVRCKNTTSGTTNTTDKEITFTVTEDGGTTDNGPKMDNLSATVSGTSATLSLITDVNATCKYDTDDVEYDQMGSNFITETGKSHTASVSNLTVEVMYTYYIRCKNTTSGAVNTTAKVISFTVESSDSGPLRYNLLPNGTVPSTSVTLSLTTGVKATCKYTTSGAGMDYSLMKKDFDTTGGTSHSEPVSGLTAGQEYIYYVRCKNDSTDVVNTTDSIISFTVSASARILPEHSQLLAASDEIINAALQNVGNFFIGTALAATGTNGTTGTTGSTTSSSSTTETEFLEEGSTEEGSGTGSFSSKLKNLKPGTFFYARAYAVSNGTTYYGNQVGFRTADSCFVATAAYGSIFHPSVQILRDFRDQFLRSNAVSRSLIDFYYSYSPTLADLISQHNSLRLVVRMLLLPVIGAAWIALHFGVSVVLLPAAAFSLMLCWQGLRLLNRKAAAV